MANSKLHEAVRRQRPEMWPRVCYMKLCVDKTELRLREGYMKLCIDIDLNCGQ